MFPWHSTVVATPKRDYSTSSKDPLASSSNTPEDASSTEAQRIIGTAHAQACLALDRAKRGPDGRLLAPAEVIRAVAESGVRLGPEGAGTLCAIGDQRQPSFQEFCRMVLTEGSAVTGVPGPQNPLGSSRGRGRGLGHLCSSAASSSSAAARGRGRASMGASRGRGR